MKTALFIVHTYLSLTSHTSRLFHAPQLKSVFMLGINLLNITTQIPENYKKHTLHHSLPLNLTTNTLLIHVRSFYTLSSFFNLALLHDILQSVLQMLTSATIALVRIEQPVWMHQARTPVSVSGDTRGTIVKKVMVEFRGFHFPLIHTKVVYIYFSQTFRSLQW